MLVQAPWSFINISIKIFYTCPSIGKCHTAVKIQPVYFVLAQFYPIKTMSQPPCFDIEYWRSYGPFLSNKSQWSRIQSVYIVCCNSSSKALITKPVVPLSTSSSTVYSDHSCAHIYELIMENFAVEIHHRRRHFFFNVFLWYRSYKYFTRYFSFLNWTWNFLLWYKLVRLYIAIGAKFCSWVKNALIGSILFLENEFKTNTQLFA